MKSIGYVITGVVSFVAGMFTGGILLKKREEKETEKKVAEVQKRADEEIASVKDAFKKKKKPSAEEVNEPKKANLDDKPSLADYVNKYKGKKLSEISKKKAAEEEPENPKIVSADEYKSAAEYAVQELYYYADGVLADDDLNKLSEEYIDKYITKKALSSFGDDEYSDAVYVLNDKRKIRYAIYLSARTFADETAEQ